MMGSGRRRDRGETLIEFAFASVMFFMLLFGTIEFGIAVFRYNMVADLAQEGARYASVHGNKSSAPVTAAGVETYVQGRALGITVTVPSPPTSNPSTLNAGDTVTVKVQTTFTPLTALIPTPTLSLSSTSQMVMTR